MKFYTSNISSNLVVVGGGPIGLLTGIKLFELYVKRGEGKKPKNIWILEKRADYTRDQIIILTEQAIQALPKMIVDELFGPNKPGCYVLSPNKDLTGTCYQHTGIFASIRISTLEKALFNYISSQTDIILVKPVDLEFSENIVKINGVPLKYDLLIGADGVNSQVRQDVMGAQLDPTPFLVPGDYYGGAFIYKQNRRKVSKYPTREQLIQNKRERSQDIARFFRTQTGDMCYIGLNLNKLEYMAIQNGQIPGTVQQRLQTTYLTFNQTRMNLDDLISYSGFETGPKLASKLYINHPSPTFLIGDAAMTTHFFTGEGFNFGVEMVETLIHLLGIHPDGMVPEIIWNKTVIELALHAAHSSSKVI